MSMNVLIVDDSNTMRRIIAGSLAPLNADLIMEAINGQEAIQVVQSQPIDLILMDWNMPVMTGIEALRQIRALGYTMPILMVTTEAEKERALEAIKAGANNYIIKPFRSPAIIEKIQETLTRSGC